MPSAAAFSVARRIGRYRQSSCSNESWNQGRAVVPRRYRLESYRPAPCWIAIWDSMYQELAPHAVDILQRTAFYQRHDLELPPGSGKRQLEGEEKAAIESIASQLTIAAHCSHDASAGIVRAWLRKFARNPALFRSKDLPPEVHRLITANYRRGDEAPGTHLVDVLARGRVRFKSKPRRPTDANIARAARRALDILPRLRGRPSNVANRLLADHLAATFKSFGGRVARRQIPMDRPGGGVRYVEDGPFHHFLKQVTSPLQAHLRQHGLKLVSIETIERIATELAV
jgi:hypothetical protein